jgi:hypothetical protein
MHLADASYKIHHHGDIILNFFSSVEQATIIRKKQHEKMSAHTSKQKEIQWHGCAPLITANCCY